MDGQARVVSVNVGRPRKVQHLGRPKTTAIVKEPVDGRVLVSGVNVEGDEQADKRVHGGPEQAVYAYAFEDYEWWQRELGKPLEPGTFGENLTLEGVDVTNARIGERWQIGSVVLEVTSPRLPCWKLGQRMGDQKFVARFADAARYGAYLRIVREGELGAGDAVRVVADGASDETIRTDGLRRLRKTD